MNIPAFNIAVDSVERPNHFHAATYLPKERKFVDGDSLVLSSAYSIDEIILSPTQFRIFNKNGRRLARKVSDPGNIINHVIVRRHGYDLYLYINPQYVDRPPTNEEVDLIKRELPDFKIEHTNTFELLKGTMVPIKTLQALSEAEL